MDQREAVFQGVKKETRNINKSKAKENETIIEEGGVKSVMTEGPGTLGFKFETGPKEGTINVDISTPYSPNPSSGITLPYSPDWYEIKLASVTNELVLCKGSLKESEDIVNKLKAENRELDKELAYRKNSSQELIAEIKELKEANKELRDKITNSPRADIGTCVLELLGENKELKRQLKEPYTDLDLYVNEISRLDDKVNSLICDNDELKCIIRLLTKQML